MDFISDLKATNIRKTIHLIRHGQTDYNLKNIIQGSGIDSDLNMHGRMQAQQFYEVYKNTPYQKIYTSELKRTIQSVEPFINGGIPHSSHSEFNEINWGIMEGKVSSLENISVYQQMIQKWVSGNFNASIEGGESPIEMYNRQIEGLKIIMQKKQEEMVLICMHGRALRSFLCLLTGSPLSEMEKWQHSNLCLYELEYNGRVFETIKSNDISHL